MKRLLIVLGAVALAGTFATWGALGGTTGWSKSLVEVVTLDEVTGIEQRTWQDRFVPGLDFLAIGSAIAAALTGASFFFSGKQSTKHNH
jgi:hypothetical protein